MLVTQPNLFSASKRCFKSDSCCPGMYLSGVIARHHSRRRSPDQHRPAELRGCAPRAGVAPCPSWTRTAPCKSPISARPRSAWVGTVISASIAEEIAPPVFRTWANCEATEVGIASEACIMALMASASLSRRWTARSTVGCGCCGDCMEAAAAHAALARRWCRNSIQGRRATSPQIDWPALARPEKITFAEMRESGGRGLLAYCSD
jgi:hypothetical protein